MKHTVLWALCGLSLFSCDRAKDLAGKAQAAIEEVKGDVMDKPEGAGVPDAALQSLVDQNEAGYIFRKDLPFPPHLRVKTRSTIRIKGRRFQSSLLGKGSGALDGGFELDCETDKQGGKAAFSMKFRPLAPVSAKDEESGGFAAKEGEAGQTPPAERHVEFHWNGKKWELSRGNLDFSNVAIFSGKDIGLELSQEGVLPKPFWFGRNRLKPGDEVRLSGPHLAMLGFKGGKGEIVLRFESVEAVAGHPCGVFSLSGLVDDARTELGEETSVKGQLTIESGKVWLSLVHPVVLKDQREMIISAKEGEGKKFSSGLQGHMSVNTEREWIIVPPPASK